MDQTRLPQLPVLGRKTCLSDRSDPGETTSVTSWRYRPTPPPPPPSPPRLLMRSACWVSPCVPVFCRAVHCRRLFVAARRIVGRQASPAPAAPRCSGAGLINPPLPLLPLLLRCRSQRRDTVVLWVSIKPATVSRRIAARHGLSRCICCRSASRLSAVIAAVSRRGGLTVR